MQREREREREGKYSCPSSTFTLLTAATASTAIVLLLPATSSSELNEVNLEYDFGSSRLHATYMRHPVSVQFNY